MPSTKPSRQSKHTSAEYQKSRDRRKRQAMAERLRCTKSCAICSIKFTTKEVGKRTLCYKANCEYLHSLQQADVWRARADKARLRMAIEHGAPACLSAEEDSQDSGCEDPPLVSTVSTTIMDAGSVKEAPPPPPRPASYPCPYRSCVNTIDGATVARMESGEIPQPVCMSLEGGTIGVCSQCPTATYWCGKHYRHHSHSFQLGSSESMFASNDPDQVTAARAELIPPQVRAPAPTPTSPPPRGWPEAPLTPFSSLDPDQFLLSLDDPLERQLDLDLNTDLGDLFTGDW